MNPSRGPAPPSASTPSAFRLAGKPPPHTGPYGAPLSAGGGLCNTLQSGRFWRVSLATLASGKLSANSSSQGSLLPATPHPLRSGLSSPLAPRRSSPAAAPRPSPGRCRPAEPRLLGDRGRGMQIRGGTSAREPQSHSGCGISHLQCGECNFCSSVWCSAARALSTRPRKGDLE